MKQNRVKTARPTSARRLKRAALLAVLSPTVLSIAASLRAGTRPGEPKTPESTTYYVSPRGDDANPGTESRPWRTLTRVNRAKFAAGDRVLLEGGQTFEGNLVIDEGTVLNPNPARPLVIGVYGRGRAVIRAGEGTAVLVKNLSGVIVRDLTLVSEDVARNRGFGVEVVNERGSSRLESIWLDNLEVRGFHWAGIYAGGLPNLPGIHALGPAAGVRYGFRQVRISRCRAHHNMYYGIWVSGPWPSWMGKVTGYANERVTIEDSLAYDNPGDPAFKDNHSGNGILLDDTDDGLIDHCTAWHNGAANGSTQGGPVGIWTDESNAVTIQFSESYDNRTGGAADGGGFDLDGGVTNSVLQYNYSHGNDGAGYLVWSYWGAIHPLAHNVIRYNISENDGRKHRYAGIHVGTSGGVVEGIAVYNNTLFMAPGAAAGTRAPGGPTPNEPVTPRVIWVGGSEPNKQIRFWNNMLISDGSVPLVEVEPHQDVTFQGNAYWAAHGGKSVFMDGGAVYGSLEQWRSAAGRESLRGEATGLAIDPKVTTVNAGEVMAGQRALSALVAYRLLPGSPLIDAGLDLGREFGIDVGAQDYWGTPIPQGNGFDVGACEAVTARQSN